MRLRKACALILLLFMAGEPVLLAQRRPFSIPPRPAAPKPPRPPRPVPRPGPTAGPKSPTTRTTGPVAVRKKPSQKDDGPRTGTGATRNTGSSTGGSSVKAPVPPPKSPQVIQARAQAKARFALLRTRLQARLLQIRLKQKRAQELAALKKQKAANDNANVAYHYTFSQSLESIKREGLRKGNFLTPNGNLSPLQAQLDLALSPTGSRDVILRINLDGLRRAGYKIPQITQVGRSQQMPGGGFEMKFEYAIPPEFIEIVEK